MDHCRWKVDHDRVPARPCDARIGPRRFFFPQTSAPICFVVSLGFLGVATHLRAIQKLLREQAPPREAKNESEHRATGLL